LACLCAVHDFLFFCERRAPFISQDGGDFFLFPWISPDAGRSFPMRFWPSRELAAVFCPCHSFSASCARFFLAKSESSGLLYAQFKSSTTVFFVPRSLPAAGRRLHKNAFFFFLREGEGVFLPSLFSSRLVVVVFFSSSPPGLLLSPGILKSPSFSPRSTAGRRPPPCR